MFEDDNHSYMGDFIIIILLILAIYSFGNIISHNFNKPIIKKTETQNKIEYQNEE